MLGIGVAEETDQGLSNRRGQMHRSTVTADHRITQGKGRDQILNPVRDHRMHRQPIHGGLKQKGLVIIPRMTRIQGGTGRPQQEKFCTGTVVKNTGCLGKVFHRPSLGRLAGTEAQGDERP